MAATTTYYGMPLPGMSDRADITQIDTAITTVDTTLHAFSTVVASVTNRMIYNYTTSSYPPRPVGLAAGMGEWIGPVQPTDWVDLDTWIDNS